MTATPGSALPGPALPDPALPDPALPGPARPGTASPAPDRPAPDRPAPDHPASGRPTLVLAVDTSAGTSVAVVHVERGILGEATELSTMKHAEVIGRLISEALSSAGVTAPDIDAVAVGMGPGPFTGLRVGIAAARAFAVGRAVPEVAVVSHDAVAEQLRRDGTRGDLLVVTDARRREVYWSLYALTGERAIRTDGPGLAKPDALPHPGVPRSDAVQVSAGALGLVALRHLGEGAPPESHEALYLRSPDVTVSAGAKRVTQ